MKLLFAVLFFFVLTLAASSNSYAVNIQVDPPVRNENTDAVTITYSGLIPNKNYKVCFDNDPQDCDLSGRTKEYTSNSSGVVSVVVCGDKNNEGNVIEGACAADEWFEARDDYNVRLYSSDKCCKEGDDIANANFDVDHFFPRYTIESPNGLKPGEEFSIYFEGTRRQNTRESRNDYKVFLEQRTGTDLQDHSCVAREIIAGSKCAFTGVEAGSYQFNVTEKDDGYSYFIIEFTIDAAGGEIGNEYKDPDDHDKLPGGGGGGGSGRNPCSNTSCDVGGYMIPTDIKGFAESILRLATGLAGGIALILMVYGSIQVLTSQGDQQKLNSGREVIVAAIAGLLFLIFSVVILRFIGINILGGIPGL